MPADSESPINIEKRRTVKAEGYAVIARSFTNNRGPFAERADMARKSAGELCDLPGERL